MSRHVSLLPDFIVEMVENINISKTSQYPLVCTEEMGILFTDIRSFTKITEKVSSKGHYGVEIITEVLRTYFNEMVHCISLCGGDVIKYGGDSIVAIFRGKRSDSLQRIDCCVKKMLVALEGINPGFQDKYGFTIAFHGGVSYGAIDACIVGDPQFHLDYYFSGVALQEAFQLGESADAGEVFFPPDFQSSSEEHNFIHPIVDEPTKDHERIGESFLPKAVRTKLKTQLSKAELRNTAVVFIGMKSKTGGATIPVDAYHLFFRELQRCVYELDGTINKIDYTDKGYLIILNFGIPLIHFDDIERAFICSYRILQIPSDAIQLRIGVTYSNIYAGIMGSTHRFEYGIIGNAVNASVRLMSAVDYGEIAFSEEILSKISSRFETLFLKTETVKGIKTPIRIFKLLRELPENWVAFNNQFKEQRLVAYEKEVETILQGFSQGKLEVAALSGEPGAGKSFLAYRIMDAFNSAGKNIELIVLDEFDQSGQMQLFFKILQRRLFLKNPAKDYPQLESYCKSKGLSLDFHLLQKYISAGKQGFEKSDESPVQEIQFLFSNIAQLLADTLIGVDLFMIDNMHWIDGSSKAILLKLLPLLHAANCKVTVTTRFRENLEFISNYRHFLLELKNLSLRGVGSMIQANLPNVSQDAITHLYQITQGNPLFIVEMCKVIQQHFNYKQDLLTEDVLLSLERQGLIPQTIENLFVNQFESLDREAQEVLKIASIIGKAFTLDDFIVIDQHMLQQETYDILHHLGSDRIINQKTFDPKVEYAFNNHLMRDAIYRTILMSEKRDLHGRIALFYEQKYGADLYPFYELLASHFQLADQIGKSCEYCRLAAEKNFSLGNFGESVYFYEMALKMTPDVQTQTELRLAFVECLLFQGNTTEAVTQFESIDPSAPIQPLMKDKLNYLRARILAMQANYIELKKYVESMQDHILSQPYKYWLEFLYLDALQFMNHAEMFEERSIQLYQEFVAKQDHRNLVKLAAVIGQFYLNQSRYQDALQYYTTLYTSARKLKDNIAKRMALTCFGIINFRKGERQKAMTFYRRALRLAEKTGDRNGYSKVILDMGTIYRNEAKYGKAIACYEKSLMFTQLTGNRLQEETILYNLGEVSYYMGKMDVALNYFEQSLEMALLISDTTGVSYAYDAIGDVNYQTGNITKSKEIYHMNLELQIKLKDNEAIAHTYGNLANVAKSEKDFELATTYYLKQVPLLEETGDIDGLGRFYFNFAMLDVEQDKLEDAILKLQKALELFTTCSARNFMDMTNEQIESITERINSRP